MSDGPFLVYSSQKKQALAVVHRPVAQHLLGRLLRGFAIEQHLAGGILESRQPTWRTVMNPPLLCQRRVIDQPGATAPLRRPLSNLLESSLVAALKLAANVATAFLTSASNGVRRETCATNRSDREAISPLN